MLTRIISSLLTYSNMELNKDSNIAVHFSVVRCYELNCSFYCTDSSNYKRNTCSYQNFHTYPKNTSRSLRLIYCIKNNLKLLQWIVVVYC